MANLVVALVQQVCTNCRETNLERTARHIRSAAGQGARLVVLQELHTSLYFCQTEDDICFDLAESVPGITTDFLGALAHDLGIVVVASLFERRAAGLYHNTAVVLDRDGGVAGTYRKMHVPDDPGYYEKYYFAPGDLGFQPIRTSVGVLGVLVCWDQWYPEAARLMALAGAELLVYPTAIGWHPPDSETEKRRQFDAWLTIQRGHAIANGIPVLCCNRVGHEASPDPAAPGIDFWGGSFVAGCQGELIGQTDHTSETVLLVHLDGSRSEQVRRTWPFFRDRRIDAYSPLLRRFGN